MRLLSLFSGCGGMDIGFEGNFTCLKKSINHYIHSDWIECDLGDKVKLKKNNFDTVFANDIRPEGKAAWVSYFSSRIPNADKIYNLGSIVDIVKEAKKGKKQFPNNIDIVTGGFPCQDFSVAGKRLGFNSRKGHDGKEIKPDEPNEENRGKLYIWMKEVISITKPKMFVAENVKGLTNLSDIKQIIESDFSKACNGGYLVIPAHVLLAAEYGVPQSRERVIFIGFKKEALLPEALENLSKEKISQKYNPYPDITHTSLLDNTNNDKLPFVVCSDAFIGLEEPEISDDDSQKKYSKAKYMGSHCQGQTEVKLNKISPTIRSEHHGNIEFRRLGYEHGGVNYEELEKNLPERRLTIRECARIQTFPDDYQFILPKSQSSIGVSASEAYKLIGNAVPCVLAYNIAKNIEKKWHLYFGE